MTFYDLVPNQFLLKIDPSGMKYESLLDHGAKFLNFFFLYVLIGVCDRINKGRFLSSGVSLQMDTWPLRMMQICLKGHVANHLHPFLKVIDTPLARKKLIGIINYEGCIM